ncbi:uncharacterized protein LOC142227267 [Haematobia irritans]|uniref:uncharacterized protein LOC142227267 n=1 Tax=Haematobia irritans TaxID=7368 RepID=UPI003F50173F
MSAKNVIKPTRIGNRKLPINLARKFNRERRIKNGGIGLNRERKRRKLERKSRCKDFEKSELDALIQATEKELKEILENEDLLSDVPSTGYTPEELEGEIALAQGGGTTIYIERDGLSTLTVVLPQDQPTIAQLKRAIEVVSRAQLKRELRERQEERMRRRQHVLQQSTVMDNTTLLYGEKSATHINGKQRIQEKKPQWKTTCESSNVVEPSKTVQLTGELVCSATHNGHQHRPCVSWRFLWRSYVLFNIATKSIINDENGRKLLSECGIENAQILKFTKREKYFGKKRQ